MHHAENRAAMVFQADHDSVQRHPLDERSCPIKWVKHPSIRCASDHLTELLPQDTMIRKGRLDAFAQLLFGPAVGKSDRRGIDLALDGRPGLKILQRNLPRLPGNV